MTEEECMERGGDERGEKKGRRVETKLRRDEGSDTQRD